MKYWSRGLSVLTGAALSCALLGTLALIIVSSTAAQEVAELAALDPGVVRWGFMAAAGVAGLSAVAAAYAVAHVGSAAIGAIAEKPELLGRVLILVGLAEGIAIYGLIVAILIINRLG